MSETDVADKVCDPDLTFGVICVMTFWIAVPAMDTRPVKGVENV